jgi:hypothetical protein
VEAAAPAISRTNFDALLGPLKQYLDDPLVRNVNVNGGDRGRVFVEHAARGKFEAPGNDGALAARSTHRQPCEPLEPRR